MSPFHRPPVDASRIITIPPHRRRPTPTPRVASPAVERIRSSPEKLDDFWARVVAAGTPLVEGDGDRRIYTWLHRGEAARVALVTNKLIDHTAYEDALFEQVEGTDLWSISLELGAGWRGSYSLAVDDGVVTLDEAGRAEQERRRARSLSVTPPDEHAAINDWYDILAFSRPDPHAHESSWQGSAAAGPLAREPLSIADPPADARGAIVPAGRAGTRWYLPPAADATAPLDVLVMLDGDRWVDADPLLFDRWHAADVVPPTAVLIVGHGDLSNRVNELGCNASFVDELVETIRRAPVAVSDDPARTTIAGQSLGGLTALFAQCLVPERFGVSICQSGSFWWPNHSRDEHAEWLTRTIERTDTMFADVHLEVGLAEWVLLDSVRRMHDALRDRTARLTYDEFDGGHDPACWSVSLPHVLKRRFSS